MSRKRICFIVNPISGIGRQKVIEKLIYEQLNRSLFDYEIAYTKAAKHAMELSADAASRNVDIVVAVGGDGSVNEIARGLVDTKTVLAIIPTGSGNGLARHLNIPINIKKAMQVINSGKTITIDTVKMNNETFVNVAGIGFDAHIGWEFSKFGKRGFSSYLKVITRELPGYKSQNFELIIEDKSIFKKAFLISFANGSQWGNNAQIAPTANISDGEIDIAILKDFNFLNALRIGYRLLKGNLHQSSFLEIIRTTEVLVKQEGKIAHIDGEPIEIGKELKIKVNPSSLNILVP